MGYEINWHARDGDSALLNSPYYQKYNQVDFGSITANDVKADIKLCLASNESAAIVSYLSWVLRVLALVA